MSDRYDMAGIIVGHANMDLDCLGSLALASRLHPEFRPVLSRRIQPAAREALTLFKNNLDFLSVKELKGYRPEHIVVVDTRSKGRIREVLEAIDGSPGTITVYDHHRNDQSDIPGAAVIDSPYGAESSHLALLCRDGGAVVGREAATMGLTGIFADTGNFTHEEVTAGDFEAAQWLLENGASRKLVRRFLRPLRREGQADLFHRLEAAVTWRRFHGHEVALARLDIPTQIPGIAEVVDRAFTAEPVDAFFAVLNVTERKQRLVIGRSRKEGLDLLKLLETFGGRGHPSAASALVKEERNVWAELLERLDRIPKQSMTAAGLMTRKVDRLSPDMSVLEASLFFEKTGHTGAPVVDDEGDVKGILTLRDVSQARKAEAMHAPVSAYMSRAMISCAPEDTIREVERKMLGKNVGHLPVLSGTRLVGLITRGDYKRFYA